MLAFLPFLIVIVVLALFGLVALRYGADSREHDPNSDDPRSSL